MNDNLNLPCLLKGKYNMSEKAAVSRRTKRIVFKNAKVIPAPKTKSDDNDQQANNHVNVNGKRKRGRPKKSGNKYKFQS